MAGEVFLWVLKNASIPILDSNVPKRTNSDLTSLKIFPSPLKNTLSGTVQSPKIDFKISNALEILFGSVIGGIWNIFGKLETPERTFVNSFSERKSSSFVLSQTVIVLSKQPENFLERRSPAREVIPVSVARIKEKPGEGHVGSPTNFPQGPEYSNSDPNFNSGRRLDAFPVPKRFTQILKESVSESEDKME